MGRISDNVGVGEFIYAPDVMVQELDGKHNLIFSLVSVIISPVRVCLRVMHNIAIMPAKLKKEFLNELITVSIAMEAIGLVNLFLNHKWPLAISQIPVLLYAYRARNTVVIAVEKDAEVTEVDIDSEQIEQMCVSVYDKLDSVLEEDSSANMTGLESLVADSIAQAEENKTRKIESSQVPPQESYVIDPLGLAGLNELNNAFLNDDNDIEIGD